MWVTAETKARDEGWQDGYQAGAAAARALAKPDMSFPPTRIHWVSVEWLGVGR